jgi:hypothetical protein
MDLNDNVRARNMRGSRLLPLGAVAALLVACASGGEGDDPFAGGDDAGPTLDASPRVEDSGSRVAFDAPAPESATADAALSGDSSSAGDDSSAAEDVAEDTVQPDPDAGQDSASPTVECDTGNAWYIAEYTAEMLSGHPTLCDSSHNCTDPSQCCFANPIAICISR